MKLMISTMALSCFASVSLAQGGQPAPTARPAAESLARAALALARARAPVFTVTHGLAGKKAEPLSYGDAHRQAMESGKPLVVWVGGNFCERCVRDTEGEFVHCFVDSFPGAAAPALVVGVPEDGQLMRAGEVTSWIEGDATWGHMPSTRRLIANWQTRRAAAPASVYQLTMRFSGRRGGAC